MTVYDEAFREGNPLLEERGKTHGNFSDQFNTAQRLKETLREALEAKTISRQHEVPSAAMREAMEMICTKLSRICHGNAYHKDHWDDISGYALLISGKLSEYAPFSEPK